MKIKIYIASAIDEDESRGKDIRSYFGKLVEGCGCEAIGAGIGDNPVISTNSPKSVCKSIIRQDLMELEHTHAFLGVTDGKTLAVGTWVELWEAYKIGQYIILYVENSKTIRSIFLKGLVDEIIYNDIEKLRAVIRELKENLK